MRIFNPTAKRSRTSKRGIVRPDAISAIVDFGMPVMIETWRIVKFLLYMISSSSIFIILLLYDIEMCISTGKYCKKDRPSVTKTETVWRVIRHLLKVRMFILALIKQIIKNYSIHAWNLSMNVPIFPAYPSIVLFFSVSICSAK